MRDSKNLSALAYRVVARGNISNIAIDVVVEDLLHLVFSQWFGIWCCLSCLWGHFFDLQSEVENPVANGIDKANDRTSWNYLPCTEAVHVLVDLLSNQWYPFTGLMRPDAHEQLQ